MNTLVRHLNIEHNMKPGVSEAVWYSSEQPLTAKTYSEARRQMAAGRGLAGYLAKDREVRAAKLNAKKATPAMK
jgi:predicted transcriptional regulator